MCSIYGVLDLHQDLDTVRRTAICQSRLLRHRGPDWSGVYAHPRAVLAHERLSIVDVNTGAQPLFSADDKQVLAVNGEIYNHRQLREELALDVEPEALEPAGFASDPEQQVLTRSPYVILLYTCRKWAGEPEALEGQELGWFDLAELESLPMPPLDLPLAHKLAETR